MSDTHQQQLPGTGPSVAPSAKKETAPSVKTTNATNMAELPTDGQVPPNSRETARRPAYIAFTQRVPFVLDAYRLGFSPGLSEEYTYQAGGPNCRVPALFLDNNFRDPDLSRWLDLFEAYQPKIGVLGDADTRAEAEQYVAVAEQLREAYPGFEPVIAPKCDCFDLIPENIIIGFAEGASVNDGKAATHPLDFSNYNDWRGRRVHILGGTPPRQYKVIETLTQSSGFSSSPPADIVGCDYNGFFPHGHGAYWTRDGWIHPNRDEIGTEFCRQYWIEQGYIAPDEDKGPHEYSLREKVKIGLHEAKRYWAKRDLWPSPAANDIYGPAVLVPDSGALTDGTTLATEPKQLRKGRGQVITDKPGRAGADVIQQSLAAEDTVAGGTMKPQERLPRPVTLVEYECGTVRAFRSTAAQHQFEQRTDNDVTPTTVIDPTSPGEDARPGLAEPPASPPDIEVPALDSTNGDVSQDE
jgi:hypothetical protein